MKDLWHEVYSHNVWVATKAELELWHEYNPVQVSGVWLYMCMNGSYH